MRTGSVEDRRRPLPSVCDHELDLTAIQIKHWTQSPYRLATPRSPVVRG